MWTTINKEQYYDFLKKNNLDCFIEELVLFEKDDKFILPKKFYNNYKNDLLTQENIINEERPSQSINIDLNKDFSPRPEQQEVFKKLKYMYDNNIEISGMIKCPPGFGKTVIGAFISCLLKKKTIIIVDKENLTEQWINTFLNFTTLNKNEIKLYTSKKSLNVPVVIAMVQKLSRRIHDNLNNILKDIDDANFGLVLYDEAHSTSSSFQFAKSSGLFRTNNIVGLSATPFHRGVAKILMDNTIGNTLYYTSEYELKPVYWYSFYRSDIDQKYNKLAKFYTNFSSKLTLYNKQLLNSKKYFEIIKKYCFNLRKANHKIIIIVSTIDLVCKISEELTSIGLENRRYYGKERNYETSDNILICTYSFAGKGFDFKELSALILGMPLFGKKSLIQVTGRILRQSQNKLQPIVVDLIDMDFDAVFNRGTLKIKTNVIENEYNCNIKQYLEK